MEARILKDDMTFLRDKVERGLAFDSQDTGKLFRIMDALEHELDKPDYESVPLPPKKTTKKKK